MTRSKMHARARIIGEERGLYQIQFSESEPASPGEPRWAVVSGSLRHEAVRREDFPAVGDWVLASVGDETGVNEADQAVIHSVLSRMSCLVRKAAGTGREAQILAANVDVAFIVTSANEDLNLRRLERYLSLVWESGARPVILLTKAELSESLEDDLSRITSAAIGVDVHAVSAHERKGLDEMSSYLLCGQTVVLLGSSGVGKSTLTNFLLGREVAATQGIRGSDGKGRHTTTSRHLFETAQGAFIIDTPGMRELQLDAHDSGITATYSEFEETKGSCRFSNCAHGNEPGCAIQAALETGELSRERWDAYRKLEREVAFQRRKEDPAEASRQRDEWKKKGMIGRAAMKQKRWEE